MKIITRYSPTMPMDSMRMPPRRLTGMTTEEHPGTVLPRNSEARAQTDMPREMRKMHPPVREITRRGAMEKEVTARQARPGQGEHAGQRIFRVSGGARRPVVIDDPGMFVQQRRQAAEEEVDLAEASEVGQGGVGHEPEVGVVLYDRHDHAGHQPVEEEGRAPFEPAVGTARSPHAEDEFPAVEVLVDHIGDDADVVLEVGIDADGCIAPAGDMFQAAEQRILVSVIPTQADALDTSWVVRRRLLDLRPGVVPRPVVHEDDEAVGVDLSVSDEPSDESGQPGHGLFQRSGFVVAGYDEGDDGPAL